MTALPDEPTEADIKVLLEQMERRPHFYWKKGVATLGDKLVWQGMKVRWRAPYRKAVLNPV